MSFAEPTVCIQIAVLGDVMIQSPMFKKQLLLPEDGPLRFDEGDAIVLHGHPVQMSFQGTSVDGADDALDHNGNMMLQPSNVSAELVLILVHGDSGNP